VCGTLRFDVVNRRTGEVLYRTYDYPSWYSQANEDGEAPSWWRAKWWEDLDDSLFLAPEAAPTPIKRAARKRA
jgi:hypothetical protein